MLDYVRNDCIKLGIQYVLAAIIVLDCVRNDCVRLGKIRNCTNQDPENVACNLPAPMAVPTSYTQYWVHM